MIKRKKEEVVELFLQRQKIDKYYSPLELAEELGYKNASRIYKALRDLNIYYTAYDRNKLLHKSFNQEALIGNLLGDGFIYYTTKKSNYPVFSVEYKHREYCEYINRINPFLHGQPINYRRRFNSRYKTGEIEQYKSTSLSSSVLKELHSKWYINNKKIVPKNIILTPQTMLIWFLDDGFKTGNTNLSIATDGFSLEDNYLLKSKLEEFGLSINFHKASSKENVRLYIPSKSAKDFLHIIGLCPVKCYQYKWI